MFSIANEFFHVFRLMCVRNGCQARYVRSIWNIPGKYWEVYYSFAEYPDYGAFEQKCLKITEERMLEIIQK